MRQSLVIGNWKMHGGLSENDKLLSELLSLLSRKEMGSGLKSAAVVCPPALYLAEVSAKIAGSEISLGAQNVCAESADSGAYTGEISAEMLVDVGAAYVLVGHSERREYYGESDDVVANKFSQAQSAGLIPVLCVGENLGQREQGETLAFISSQIKAVVEKVGMHSFGKAVIAYEPIWAIGTGETASPEQAQEVHAHIRQEMAGLDEQIAEKLQLLYGGSVKADNAASLFSMADIDGALVGGASLKAEEFSAICKAAE